MVRAPARRGGRRAHPGTDFDGVRGGDWVRLSFAAAPSTVAEAVERIAAWRRTL